MTVEEVMVVLGVSRLFENYIEILKKILTEAKAEWELAQRERCWTDLAKSGLFCVGFNRKKEIKAVIMNATAKKE